VLASAGGEWAHGFTYSGHPVAAAVALENLRIIEAEGLHERAGGPLGAYFGEALAGLADHPLVGEARTCGLLGALELVEDKATRRYFPPARQVGLACREHCIANGLVMRAVRDVMILAPPLIITEAEIDQMVETARLALDLTWRDLQAA
jgi:putrescine aminotransferase